MSWVFVNAGLGTKVGWLAVEDLSALLQSRECRVADVKITKTKLDLHRPRLARLAPAPEGGVIQSQPPKEETGTEQQVVIDHLVLCMIKRADFKKDGCTHNWKSGGGGRYLDIASMYLELMYQPSIVPQHLGQGVSSGPLP